MSFLTLYSADAYDLLFDITDESGNPFDIPVISYPSGDFPEAKFTLGRTAASVPLLEKQPTKSQASQLKVSIEKGELPSLSGFYHYQLQLKDAGLWKTLRSEVLKIEASHDTQ